jgi:hypothetical protein
MAEQGKWKWRCAAIRSRSEGHAAYVVPLSLTRFPPTHSNATRWRASVSTAASEWIVAPAFGSRLRMGKPAVDCAVSPGHPTYERDPKPTFCATDAVLMHEVIATTLRMDKHLGMFPMVGRRLVFSKHATRSSWHDRRVSQHGVRLTCEPCCAT